MRSLHRLPLIVLSGPVVILGLAFIAFVVNSFWDSRARTAFQKVEMNDPESRVISLLGKPDTEGTFGENLWWGGDGDYRGKNDGRCKTEVRYEYFLSAWAIGYSADRHVVSKYHYFSE